MNQDLPSHNDRHRAIAARRKRLLAETKDRTQQLYEDRMHAATLLRDQVCSPGSSLRVIVTPSNHRNLVSLSNKRKSRFVKRLCSTIENVAKEKETEQGTDGSKDGLVQADEGVDRSGDLVPIAKLGEVCGNCRGKCCARGGTRAYLCEDTVRRVWSDRPLLEPRELLQLFTERLPQATYQGSCVFHSETGCGLPVQLRSATCNTMVCGGLVELEQRVLLDGDRQFFVAACRGSSVVRTVTIDLDA
ncbi:hypothetical protein LOC67_16405 [Stieleria sp. JC731]|uniref:hypothetical protein n=1 Tax=Pirellulaceae TaxID=2691357 RepID=UPI001E5D6B36|nr:hypothetical protein [Stieleria sp. JC731]MCC9602142.1 hypothetical protein [Stieleria sp. JC731]